MAWCTAMTWGTVLCELISNLLGTLWSNKTEPAWHYMALNGWRIIEQKGHTAALNLHSKDRVIHTQIFMYIYVYIYLFIWHYMAIGHIGLWILPEKARDSLKTRLVLHLGACVWISMDCPKIEVYMWFDGTSFILRAVGYQKPQRHWHQLG